MIFRARTRMLNVKGNYKSAFTNEMKCRACQEKEEDQTHIHPTPKTKVTTEEIFNEDTNELRKTATKIEKIMDKLEKIQTITKKNKRNKDNEIQ